MNGSRDGMYADWSIPGADVGKPADFPLFDDSLDIDALIDSLSRLESDRPRRLGGVRGRATPPRRSSAGDSQPPQEPKIDLVLYTSPASEKSRRAMRAVEQVLRRYDMSQVRFVTCDLSKRPQDGDADSVVFTPTLVKQGPGPRTSIIGNLEREEILCDLLDASGVDRRWDD